MIPVVSYDPIDREFVVSNGRHSHTDESALESLWPHIKAAGALAKALNMVYAEHIPDYFANKAVDAFESLANWSNLMADRFATSPVVLFDGFRPKWHYDTYKRLRRTS